MLVRTGEELMLAVPVVAFGEASADITLELEAAGITCSCEGLRWSDAPPEVQ
jgi:hypothetical protein